VAEDAGGAPADHLLAGEEQRRVAQPLRALQQKRGAALSVPGPHHASAKRRREDSEGAAVPEEDACGALTSQVVVSGGSSRGREEAAPWRAGSRAQVAEWGQWVLRAERAGAAANEADQVLQSLARQAAEAERVREVLAAGGAQELLGFRHDLVQLETSVRILLRHVWKCRAGADAPDKVLALIHAQLPHFEAVTRDRLSVTQA